MTKENDKATEFEEIAKNLFVIRLASRIPAIKLPVNLYFFAGEDGLLWDAGYGGELAMAKMKRILEAIRKKMAERGEKCAVKRILVSHAHLDHFSGLSGLKKLTGAKVLLTANQAKKIKDYPSFKNAWRGKPEDIWGRLPFIYHYLDRIVFKLEEWFYGISFLPEPDEIIPETGVLRAGSRILQYFPIPGHADDHLALYDAAEGLLLAGDHVMHRTTWLGAPLGDIEAYEKSLIRLKELNPLKRILPAHGSPIEDPLPHLEKTLERSGKRRGKIRRILEKAGGKGLSYFEIIGEAYPKASVFYRLSAHGWVIASLQALLKNGEIGLRYKRGQQFFSKKPKA